MRIVLINQFFGEDLAPTGRLLSELAASLATQELDMVVLCGAGAYSADHQGAFPENRPPNIEIRQVPAIAFGRGIRRVFSYASFLASALVTGLLMKRADVVVTLTSPPMLPVVGTILKAFGHRKHFIWEMDLFPDALVDVGYSSKDSLLIRALGFLADLARRRSDGVIVLGECMRQRLIRRGIPTARLFLGENWADGRTIRPLPFLNDNASLKILYSGNLGLTHDVGTILDAMSELKNDSRFMFRFAGGGEKYASLQGECQKRGMLNARFMPYCRREDLSISLASADLGLVTQLEACEGTVVPSKVYSLLAAGRPVLFVGPRGAMPARIVRKHDCGWQVDVGDVARLVDLLKRLKAEPLEVRAAGQRAREAFLAHYDLPHGVARISEILGIPVEVPADRAIAAVQ